LFGSSGPFFSRLDTFLFLSYFLVFLKGECVDFSLRSCFCAQNKTRNQAGQGKTEKKSLLIRAPTTHKQKVQKKKNGLEKMSTLSSSRLGTDLLCHQWKDAFVDDFYRDAISFPKGLLIPTAGFFRVLAMIVLLCGMLLNFLSFYNFCCEPLFHYCRFFLLKERLSMTLTADGKPQR